MIVCLKWSGRTERNEMYAQSDIFVKTCLAKIAREYEHNHFLVGGGLRKYAITGYLPTNSLPSLAKHKPSKKRLLGKQFCWNGGEIYCGRTPAVLFYRYDAKEGFFKMKAGVRDLNRDVWGQVLRSGRLSKHSGCAEGTKKKNTTSREMTWSTPEGYHFSDSGLNSADEPLGQRRSVHHKQQTRKQRTIGLLKQELVAGSFPI